MLPVHLNPAPSTGFMVFVPDVPVKNQLLFKKNNRVPTYTIKHTNVLIALTIIEFNT